MTMDTPGFKFLVFLCLIPLWARSSILVNETKNHSHLEREIIIQSAKIYFAHGEKPSVEALEKFTHNLEDSWTVTNQTNDDESRTISVELKFENGIEKVESLEQVKMKGDSDILFYVTDEATIASHKKWLASIMGVGEAAAFVEGRLCVINYSQFLLLDLNRKQMADALSTAAHEMGHLGGLGDDYYSSGAMNNAAPIQPTYVELENFFKFHAHSVYSGLVKRLEKKKKS